MSETSTRFRSAVTATPRAQDEPTVVVRFRLPLPADVTGSIIMGIGTMWPTATILTNGDPREMAFVIPVDGRRAKLGKKALAAAKQSSADPAEEIVVESFGGNDITLSTPREATLALADFALTILEGMEGVANYIEQTLDLPDGRRLALVACWSPEQTPRQLRKAAERRTDAADRQVTDLTERLEAAETRAAAAERVLAVFEGLCDCDGEPGEHFHGRQMAGTCDVCGDETFSGQYHVLTKEMGLIAVTYAATQAGWRVEGGRWTGPSCLAAPMA